MPCAGGPINPITGGSIRAIIDKQHRRVITGTPGHLRRDLESQAGKIQLIDEDINDPYRVILSNEVIEPFGKQGALISVGTLNESFHPSPTRQCDDLRKI